jgi:ubiquitin-conjugating enzyme E2 J2
LTNPLTTTTTTTIPHHYHNAGAKGSPYEGGFYHGKLKFPPEYPLKPPSILMLTPSGRFKPNTRLCLSMSDFHPETWNPMCVPLFVGPIVVGVITDPSYKQPTTHPTGGPSRRS